jgi:hypothetical protein
VRVIRRLRDYRQKSSRAGRNELKSKAILLREVWYDQEENVFNLNNLGKDVEENMQEFITTKNYMWVILNQAIDGREDRIGCEKGEERCDQCQAKEVTSVGEREEEKEMLVVGEAVKKAAEDRNKLKMIEFEQEMGQQRVLAFREIKLQLAEVLKILALKKRLEEWKEGYQEYRAANKEKVEYKSHSI